MKTIKTISLMFAFLMALPAMATPSWFALYTEAATADVSPSTANAGRYSAYYCTVAAAEAMFGSAEVSAIEGRISGNFYEERNRVAQAGSQLGTKYYGADQYSFISYVGGAIPAGEYVSMLFYDGGRDLMVRVFGKDNLEYEGGNAYFDDTGSGSVGAWSTATVPEPTGGLLMLLGMAGLALRRKRAL